MGTGVIFGEIFKKHDTGDGHPESPERMDAARRAIETPAIASKLTRLSPRAAEREEILLVHWDRLYQEVLDTRGTDQSYLDSDTVASSDSSDVAHQAVGAMLVGVDVVMEGELQNAFALIRPPGHHAKPDKAMGFCLFNNVAVAARYAQRKYQLRRVAVIDFDVHHGNGTQKAFYTSPEVLYVSLHESPHYPGTGALTETGKDDGLGYTLNVPVPAGIEDGAYLHLFRELVVPACREFAPELVLVSAGFDAHRDDPLGSLCLTASGFGALTQEIGRIAEPAKGRIVLGLEGGYHLGALEQSIVAVLRVLTGEGTFEVPSAGETVRELAEDVRSVHKEFWKSLRV